MTNFLQQFLNGAVAGSRLGLLGASFAIIVGVTGRFHVAYTAAYVGATYFGIWLHDHFDVPIVLSAIFGLIFAALLGMFIEGVIYRRIAATAAKRGADTLIPIFIAALGITIVLQNAISWYFNTQPLSFNLFSISGLNIGEVYFTSLDVITVIVCWVVIMALWVFLRYTHLGSQIQGVQVNAEMSRVVGINVGRIFLLVFAIGSVIAGVLGILEANQTSAIPQMGFNSVFYGFVVAFVAGMERGPLRTAIVGLIVGLVQSLSALWLPLQYGSAVVFTVLLVYLILLPTDLRKLIARIRSPRPASAGA